MAEVLSVCTIQYKSVLEGIRAGGDNFRFNGKDVFLHPDGCMAFITMNPGYLGRQELPESLKVLFRPTRTLTLTLSLSLSLSLSLNPTLTLTLTLSRCSSGR